MKKYINLLSVNVNYLLAILSVFMAILTANVYDNGNVNIPELISECFMCIMIFLAFYVLFELPRKF